MSIENTIDDELSVNDSMSVKIFERTCNIMGILSILTFMFAPLILIFYYRDYLHTLQGTNANAVPQGAVGVAVLLRATSRRLIRTGASNVMRTTFATFFRATSRTFTRKMVRVVVHSLFGVIAKEVMASRREEKNEEAKVQSPIYALLLGFVGLACSFWGVLMVVTPDKVAGVLSDGKISILTASVAAAFPVLMFGLFTYVYSRRFGVQVIYNTAIDGLVLQAYFTAAGSFLPMTTDVDYVGDKKNKMKAAVATLISMFLVHQLFFWSGKLLVNYGDINLPILNFTSSMFLVYCFIFSFPIRPLEGHDVWSQSRLLWLIIWIPILLSFTFSIDPAFTNIL